MPYLLSYHHHHHYRHNHDSLLKGSWQKHPAPFLKQSFMMKPPSTATTIALLIVCCSIWKGVSGLAAVNRKTFWKNLGAATAGVAVAFAPLLAVEAANPQIFNHQYEDPKHPNCKRIVVVKKDGTAAISGTEGKPGCPEDGSGEIWRLTGEVLDNNIVVDFSSEGGPADAKGVWDGDGIKWTDGNKWNIKN